MTKMCASDRGLHSLFLHLIISLNLHLICHVQVEALGSPNHQLWRFILTFSFEALSWVGKETNWKLTLQLVTIEMLHTVTQLHNFDPPASSHLADDQRKQLLSKQKLGLQVQLLQIFIYERTMHLLAIESVWVCFSFLLCKPSTWKICIVFLSECYILHYWPTITPIITLLLLEMQKVCL